MGQSCAKEELNEISKSLSLSGRGFSKGGIRGEKFQSGKAGNRLRGSYSEEGGGSSKRKSSQGREGSPWERRDSMKGISVARRRKSCEGSVAKLKGRTKEKASLRLERKKESCFEELRSPSGGGGLRGGGRGLSFGEGGGRRLYLAPLTPSTVKKRPWGPLTDKREERGKKGGDFYLAWGVSEEVFY